MNLKIEESILRAFEYLMRQFYRAQMHRKAIIVTQKYSESKKNAR